MSQAGRQVNLPELNNKASAAVIQLREALEVGHRLFNWLADQTDADLSAIGLSDAGEIYKMRRSAEDLEKLFNVWEGRALVSPAYDFRQITEKLPALD